MLRTTSLVIMKQESLNTHDTCCNSLSNSSVDLHHAMEVEELKARLAESNSRLLQFQKESSVTQDAILMENSKLQDDLNKLRDRYERLLDSHKKLQKNNHTLESNLLKSVEKLSGDRTSLEEQVRLLTTQVIDAKLFISDLHETIERYRNDCNLAVQLLQCKPSTFLPQSLSSLSPDIQYRVKNHISTTQAYLDLPHENSSGSRPSRVPIPTFPPTAIVYSTPKMADMDGDSEEVPISVIAQVLLKQNFGIERRGRVVVCPKCLVESVLVDAEIQTDDGSHYLKDFTPNVHRTRVFAVEHI